MRFFQVVVPRTIAAPAFLWLAFAASRLLVVAAAAAPLGSVLSAAACSPSSPDGDPLFLAPSSRTSISVRTVGSSMEINSPVHFRGGAVFRNHTKKKADVVAKSNKNSQIKKKSPFGLPVLVGPTLYGHLDFIPQLFFFAYFSSVFEGMARQIFRGVGLVHTLHFLATDFDGKGSYMQRFLGMKNIAVPYWTMYWADIALTTVFGILPSLGVVDGYTDEKSIFLVRATAIGGLFLFFPFCGSN